MAEFMEVMRQARRLCAAHGGMCNYRNCPLDNGKECRLNIELDGEDYNELERIIMDWAKKKSRNSISELGGCVEADFPERN